MEQKYLIDKEVGNVVLLEDKTPAGNDMVEVHLTDGSKEIMPKMRYELLATPTPIDASTAQQKIKARVSAITFGSYHEYGVKMGEVNGIMDATTELVNNGFTKAQDVIWGKEYNDIPLIDVNNILVKNVERQRNNENNDGATPGGGGADTSDKK